MWEGGGEEWSWGVEEAEVECRGKCAVGKGFLHGSQLQETINEVWVYRAAILYDAYTE